MWRVLLSNILFSAEWPKTSCIGKRRKREKNKRKTIKRLKKRKGKKDNRRKEEKKGGGSKQNKKQGMVSHDSIYCKTSKSPRTFQCCLVNNFLFPYPCSWSSGEGPVVLIFRCYYLGELLGPLPGAGLSGGCFPREAHGGTTMAVAALETWILPQQ